MQANTGRKCYPSQVRVCDVSVTTPNGQTHSLTVQAASLFDAARQGCDMWAKMSWWDPNALIVVSCDGQKWKVTADRVRQWDLERRQKASS